MNADDVRRPKVLVVEDERVMADTLAMILSLSGGYQCSAVYDGWEGLRKAQEMKPDVIISGVFLGDGPNGIDMVIQIHAEMPETKFFLFSGNKVSADLREKAIADGASFLTEVPVYAKPVHPKDLLDLLRSHLNPDADSA